MNNLVVAVPVPGPENNIHAVALDPHHEVHVLYKLMMEMLVMAEMQKVYEEQTGRAISDRCNILLTKQNLDKFAQGVYEKFLSYPDTQFPVKSVQNWLIQSFRDLNDARKTITRLTCKVVESLVTSVDQLETFFAQQFAGLVSEDVKIGLPDESINYQGDYDRIKLALDQTYETLPILVVMETFKSADHLTVDQIVSYFGAHHLMSLNKAQFWNQFETVEKILEYISESPEPLAESPEPLTESPDHVITSSQVHDCFYDTLLQCLSPLFRDKYGLEKRDFPLFDLVTVLRGLRAHDCHVTSSRKLFSESHCFSPGSSDNRLFFKWSQEVGLYSQDFAKSQQKEFSISKRRREEDQEEEMIEGKRPSLENVFENKFDDEDLFEGKKLSPQTSPQTSPHTSPQLDGLSDDDLFAGKNLSPVVDHHREDSPPWTLVESRRHIDDPLGQLIVAKRTVSDLVSANPQWCPLCMSLGHNSCFDNNSFNHPFELCPLNHILEIRDYETMIAGGHLTNHLLYKLRKLESQSYLEVYTDGSQTIRANGVGCNSGVGVWFDDFDSDNEALPCHAKTPLETELMAIILALRKLQTRKPHNYEICCDSVRACNLANGYGIPSAREPRHKEIQRLVAEAVNLQTSLLPKKVRMTYVKGHSGIKGNCRAHNLAKEGREMMEHTRLQREQFFWPFEG